MTHPYLRPSTGGDILQGAFRIYRDHLALLVQVALWPSLVLLGLQTLLLWGGEPAPEIMLLFALLTVLLNGLALVALTHAFCRIVIGPEPGVRAVFQATFRGRIVPPLLAFLLLNFLVSFPLSPGLLLGNSLLFMLGLFPALIAGALFFPALPASVVERRGTLSALGRSVSLLRRKLNLGIAAFGFYIFITVFLPTLILSVQLSVGLGPLTPLLFALISSVTLPLGYAAPMLVYLSRIAEEGATPTLLAEALGLVDETQPPTDQGAEPGTDAAPPSSPDEEERRTSAGEEETRPSSPDDGEESDGDQTGDRNSGTEPR